jgi:hypothetical protein
MIPLLRVSDTEFLTELSSAIHEDDWFKEFMEPETADRTRTALIGMKQSIIAQLQKYKNEDDEWRSRATSKMRAVDHRLAQLKGLRRHVAGGEAKVRAEWSNFAFDIAMALEASNMAPMLDQIYLNTMSARDFLEGAKRMRNDNSLDALFREDEG